MKNIILSSRNNTTASELSSLRDALNAKEFQTFERCHSAFNVFKALGIGNYEIRHSNMLAWLMSPRASHNVGWRFLKGVLAEIQKANPERYKCLSSLKDDDFASGRVLREDEHMDIRVDFPKAKVVLVMENKWNAGESEGESEDDGQLKKYKRAIDSQFGDDWKKVFIFLTPEGRSPSKKNHAEWGVFGYGAIREILVSLLNGDSAVEDLAVKTFINHYKTTIEERIGCMNPEEERLCEEIYAKHHEAIDLVVRHHNAIKDRLVSKLREGIPVSRGEMLTCSPVKRSELYIQYNRRLPSDSTQSVHYEIVVPRDDGAFQLEVHVEGGTDKSVKDQLLHDIQYRANSVLGLIHSAKGAKARKVEWANCKFDEVYDEICQKMKLLYDTFERIIVKYDKRQGDLK